METVEVETRYRLGPGVTVPTLLAEIGVQLSRPVRQDDQAYAPAAWAYGDDRINVSFARLRTQDESHLFTVKRPITDVRTCIEHECEVSDRDAMHSAILLMGYRPTVRIVKTRRSASLDQGIAICLDEVEHVGLFMELEVLASPDDNHDELRAELEAIVDRLGIDAEPCNDTYDSLVYAAAYV